MEGEARKRALGSFGWVRPSPSSDRWACLPREQWGRDPIVEMELDAAQARAEMAILEEQGNKRIENHGSPSTSREHEHLVGDYQEDNEAVKDAMEERKGGQQSSEWPKADITCSTSHTPFSSRVRQNLTEAEKEAKRMRRILANRESARQTIRRRQVIREQLTKKFADLSLKNKNMKMEKELVMKEYLSLKDANHQLKEQVWSLVSSSDVKGGPVAGHDDGTSLEKSGGGASSQPNEKLLIAAAAAQARKRRKELTRLKQLHGSQVGLHS
ncbi:hypothetical protein COCNU_15G000790 [Cocos nucifera]|uniref:BZIP domain-containing protein n=1 Tax=Cocos nucifera TaxID=13894 RepID=A0A8K0NDS9_COCNU|nr:hypothetical protein COCNU_15G000790 [Cocos nucifera]